MCSWQITLVMIFSQFSLVKNMRSFYFHVCVSKAFNQGSLDDLVYVNFGIDEFYYLNITSLSTALIEDESECGFACLEIPSCLSYNVAAFPDINGKLLCELLPSDKYNNSDKFVPSKVFHHLSIPVS